ncbi:hypothetical protein [Streptomyces sp. NPDC059092]|uniref:hypothetical protein n=1 Tax=Streptomyces sp. NPDC059092 TaxID=3346725 RepID=UPI0036BF43D7
MGIESDQLVYDYLSRVGDAAQQQHLPSGDRMRLVSTLRNEIDKQRGKFGTDSPAAVRRILGRLGEPHVVVREAARRDGDDGTAAARAPEAPEVAVPVQRTGLAKGLGLLGAKGPREPKGSKGPKGPTGSRASKGPAAPKGLAEPEGPAEPTEPEARPAAPEPVTPPPAASPPVTSRSVTPPPAASPFVAPPVIPLPAGPEDVPGRAPEAQEKTGPATEPGPRIPAQASESPVPPSASRTPPRARQGPDWWRIDSGPGSGPEYGHAEPTHGFVGGVEIPDMLRPPPPKKTAEQAEATDPASAADGADGAGTEAADAPEDAEGGTRPRRRLRLRPRPRQAKGNGLSNPFLLLAAALLVAGAFLGSWLALGGGWLLAYASRTLSRAEAKWAVFGLPGVSAAGGLVWIWGRLDGRWGEMIPKDGMADALSGVWPVVLRTAAVSSALYLVWRARRKPAR